MTDKASENKKFKAETTSGEEAKSCPLTSYCRPLMGMGLAAFVLIIDQLSKWVVLNHLMVPPQTLSVTSFFNIVLTWNRGVSFGLFSGANLYGPWILAAIACVFIAVIILWVWQADTKIIALAFGSVLGGAIGNLLDRLRFGAVTDFLDFHAFGYHWYTFNIADAAIVIGVALILFEYLRELSSENKKQPS
jgi:signal peptidase II